MCSAVHRNRCAAASERPISVAMRLRDISVFAGLSLCALLRLVLRMRTAFRISGQTPLDLREPWIYSSALLELAPVYDRLQRVCGLAQRDVQARPPAVPPRRLDGAQKREFLGIALRLMTEPRACGRR